MPLTEAQRLMFASRQEGCIKITPNNFRFDFEQSRDNAFNQTAISVFAGDLHDKLAVEHWYRLTYEDPHPLAEVLMTVDYLEYTLYHHLKHAKEVYNQTGQLTRTQRLARLKAASRKQRKQTVRSGPCIQERLTLTFVTVT